jgi:hypothetical protein
VEEKTKKEKKRVSTNCSAEPRIGTSKSTAICGEKKKKRKKKKINRVNELLRGAEDRRLHDY